MPASAGAGSSQQHVARLVDAGGEPVGTAAIRMGSAHQPMMGGPDLGVGGPGPARAPDMLPLVSWRLPCAAAAGGAARWPPLLSADRCRWLPALPEQRSEHGQGAKRDAPATGQDSSNASADAAECGDPGQQRLDRGHRRPLEGPQAASSRNRIRPPSTSQSMISAHYSLSCSRRRINGGRRAPAPPPPPARSG